MIYLVTYKRWSDVQKAMLLVSQAFEASHFGIVDGVLVLYQRDKDDRAVPFFAAPPGLWAGIGPEDPGPDPALIS